jgi:hypothetical protein
VYWVIYWVPDRHFAKSLGARLERFFGRSMGCSGFWIGILTNESFASLKFATDVKVFAVGNCGTTKLVDALESFRNKAHDQNVVKPC